MTAAGARRGWMLVVGAIVVVGGLVAAGALWYASGQRFDDNVSGFARAPSGCATTLDFERTGSFVLYLETAGSLGDLAGDCSASTDFDRGAVDDPVLDLVDAEGNEVAIDDSPGKSYDAAGFVGERIGTVEIETAGDHVLTVAPDGAQFAVAIGTDVDDGVTVLRWSALSAAIAALVVGGLLLVFGSRRPPASAPAPVWQPGDQPSSTWPAAPPGFPPPPRTTGAVGPAGPPLVTPGSPPPQPLDEPESPGDPPPPQGPPGWGPPSVGQ
jgi:hypothetical protein